MRTGRSSWNRRLAGGLLALSVILGPADHERRGRAAANESIASLDELFAALRRSPGISASFEESKEIALLKRPLVSRGHVYFKPPRDLARHVESPTPSRLVLSRGRVRISDARGTREMDLGAAGAARALVEGFVQVLSGDRPGLEKNFGITFVLGEAGSWKLRLEPKAEGLRRAVVSMELRGVALRVDRMVLWEGSGDRTVTRFGEVDSDRRFSESEVARFFEVPFK
jgi:hypothetical protein